MRSTAIGLAESKHDGVEEQQRFGKVPSIIDKLGTFGNVRSSFGSLG